MIEPVSADSAALLASLHARAFAQPWTASEIAALLANPSCFALLARSGEPTGFVMGWAVAADAELLTLAVVPQWRRKGVASALVNAASAAASLRGAGSMHLEVAEDNLAARALYTRLGYTEAGRRRGYYAREGGAADAVVMKRTLDAPA